ncbi:MAG: tyrosine-type recombinase/integrase, partial [Ktedonobacterales bacterium]
LDPLIEGYLSYLAAVGRKAPGTVKDVRCSLKRAGLALDRLRPGVAMWKCGLEDLLRWLEREREAGRSAASIAKDVSHLRGLLNYAWRCGRAERNALDGFSLNDTISRVEPRSLTLEEAAQLVAACRNLRERRDRLIVLLLYGCGLRTGELCALDVCDVVRERQELLVRKGKNDRPRVVPIPHGVYTELLAYLLDRGRRGALFRTSTWKRRLSIRQVSEIVVCAARLAALPGRVTPKALRHSFATHLMDRGVDLAVIASLMGHRTPSETGVYLHVLPGKREAALRTLSIGGSK